jgi:hypothetical protein
MRQSDGSVRARPGGRTVSLVAAVAMVMVLGQPSSATATGGRGCWVRNTSQHGAGSDLQAAIDAAGPGDTLRVRGVCAGSFTVEQDLTLVGPAGLDGEVCGDEVCSRGIVLWVDAGTVTLQNVTITNGASTYDGGGVWNFGTLILKGCSSVRGNTAEDNAGGIHNFGTLIMTGRSSVTRNSLYYVGKGGGVWNAGVMIMNGSSLVAGNTGSYGGGIYNQGTLRLNGASSVTGNTAEQGGGILNEGTVTFGRGWGGTVCGNEPDDWPGCES